MGLQLTTNQTNTYRTHFSKRLLKTLQETVVLEQFATKESLPQGQGADTVRFFIEPDGNASDVVELAENTVENTTFSDNDLGYVDVQLKYWGDKMKISNRLSLTSFFDRLKSGTRKMGLSAGYFCDKLIRDELVSAQATAGHKRYAGGAGNFNALVALTAANSPWTPILGLAAVTQLKVSKATPFGDGDFITVVPPEIAYDLVQHPKWEEPAKYAGAKQIFKRELGRLYGQRYVEATNPFREASTNDTEGTFAAAGGIYSVLTLGEEAVGFVDLAGGNSAFKPKMTILDKADKSDPHNQFIIPVWSAYARAKTLAQKRYVVTRCKTTFA
jgi:N4-gp56 family major capsid protein